MGTEPILELNGSMATIRLGRPEAANRLGKNDLGVLKEQIARVNATDDIVVLRILASGPHFCSGYDLLALGQDQGHGTDVFGDVMDDLEQARPISIVGIHGPVYGGGTDLCLACDFRIGVPECEMQMPAAKLGIHLYQGGLERYVSRLGLNAAKKLLLTAEKIDSSAMLDLGFLTEIVPLDKLHARVDQLTKLLQSMSPVALLSVKKHLNRIARSQVNPAELEADIARSRESKDSQERIRAWKQRRSTA